MSKFGASIARGFAGCGLVVAPHKHKLPRRALHVDDALSKSQLRT